MKPLRRETGLRYEKRRSQEYSLHSAIAPALVISSIFGFFPVKGITSRYVTDLEFSYWNWRSMYSYLVVLISSAMGLMSIFRLLRNGIGLDTAGDIMFFMGNTIGIFIFLNLAANWKELMLAWSDVELIFPPNKRRTKLKISFMISIITFLSLFEHLSADANTLTTILKEEHISWKIFAHYFRRAYKMMFDFIPVYTFLGVIFSCINLVDVMVWNYMDLMIIMLSIAMTDLFHSVNVMFERSQEKMLDREDWRLLRETYNRVHALTHLLNNKISLLVLISIGSNLYFICLQLLNSLRPMKSLSQRVYFYSSFGYLLARTLAVCLSAASIPIEAAYPLKVLYATPSHSYNIEVQRLITQINSTQVALSGCKFFTITRSLIITILGTIITYEVVLVQFNSLMDDSTPPPHSMNKRNNNDE